MTDAPVLQIVSLRDCPELAPAAHGLIRDYFWDMEFCHQDIDRVIAPEYADKRLPQGWVLRKDGQVAGWAGLIVNDPITTDEFTPILGPLVIAEAERNNGYGPLLIYHVRRAAARLGYEQIYLTSQHIGYYERFGFREIAMTQYSITGKPTKVYCARTIGEPGQAK